MNKKIRFAVIGCGHIGKRHAEMITRDEGAELVALCDIRPRAELGIEAYDVPFYPSLEALLQSEKPDVINICTPNGLHADSHQHLHAQRLARRYGRAHYRIGMPRRH